MIPRPVPAPVEQHRRTEFVTTLFIARPRLQKAAIWPRRSYRRLDAPENIPALYELGARAAEQQIQRSHLERT
jgi:hypothetical protein